MLTKKENLGLFDHSYNKGGKKGRVSEQTNKMDLLRDWPKLALDRELWREVASRC